MLLNLPIIKCQTKEVRTKVLGPQVIDVFGAIGLGIEASDKMNADEKNYNLGIYSMELKIDGNSVYHFHFDKFPLLMKRHYANAHVDSMEMRWSTMPKYNAVFRLPGSR